MQVIKNNVSLEATPTSDTHIVNKGYVDGKTLTINWADYQALSEAEKNNGTVYYIPDMPVSTSGEAIGEVERLNGYLVSDTPVSFGDVIPFIADGNSNMTITNGLVTLKKGKTYNIQCDLRCGFSASTSTNAILNVKDTNGNVYGKGIIDIKNGETGYLSGNHTSYSYSLTPSNDTTIGVYVTSNTNSIIIMSIVSKLTITEIPSLQACIDVTDEHIKEVATSLNCSWHTKDISLSTNLTEWGNESITVPEIINSKKVMLYDGTNQSWTPIFENIGEVIGMIYTNGLGVTDAYNFSQKIHIDFTNGNVMNISMRKLTSTGNPPNFTKIAYYK